MGGCRGRLRWSGAHLNASFSFTSPNADGSGRRQSGVYRDDHTKALGRLVGQGGCSKLHSPGDFYLHILAGRAFSVRGLGWGSLVLKIWVCASRFFLPLFSSGLHYPEYFLKGATNSVIYSPVLKRAYVCKQTPSTVSPLRQTWIFKGIFLRAVTGAGRSPSGAKQSDKSWCPLNSLSSLCQRGDGERVPERPS